MKRGPSIWLAFALVAALAITVPLKFLMTPVAWRYHPIDGPLVEFLTRHGLQPSVEKRLGGAIIHVTSGECRMLIMEMEARGTNLDRIDSAGRAAGAPVTFVVEDALLREPPVRRNLMKYYWVRLQQRLGVNARLRPVLAVVASAACPVDTLPWKEISWPS